MVPEAGHGIFVEDAAFTVLLCFALVLAGCIWVVNRGCMSFHIQGIGKHIYSCTEFRERENMDW